MVFSPLGKNSKRQIPNAKNQRAEKEESDIPQFLFTEDRKVNEERFVVQTDGTTAPVFEYKFGVASPALLRSLRSLL